MLPGLSRGDAPHVRSLCRSLLGWVSHSLGSRSTYNFDESPCFRGSQFLEFPFFTPRLPVHKNVGPVTASTVAGPTCRRGDENHSAALGWVMSAGTTHLSKSSSLMPPTVRADSRRLIPLW
ncbi:hypothetical protein E5345_09850 [Propionibacterium sp. NM47_B9-13]|nr:hypothetical protein E5345_09850 [Propionibacterium sp. NM47_B9-13]